jgi:hypothetical protein
VDSGDGLGEEVDAAGLGLEAADGLGDGGGERVGDGGGERVGDGDGERVGDGDGERVGDGDGERVGDGDGGAISQWAPVYPLLHTHISEGPFERQAWPLHWALPVLLKGLQYAPPEAIAPVAR